MLFWGRETDVRVSLLAYFSVLSGRHLNLQQTNYQPYILKFSGSWFIENL